MKWREIRFLPVAAILIVALLYWVDKDPGYNDIWKSGKEYMMVTLFVITVLLALYIVFCGLRYAVKKSFQGVR